MTTQAPAPPLPLDAAEQQAWRTLERFLRRTSGFALIVYMVNTPQLAYRLRDRVAAHLGQKQKHLRIIAAERADGFAEQALHALLDGAGSDEVGAIWLEAHRGAGQEDWDSERRKLLLRLNERRGRLESELRSALILLLPASGAALMAELAPDLWHVRIRSESLRSDAGVSQPDSAIFRMPARRAKEVGEGSAIAGADAGEALREWRRQWREVFGAVDALHLSASHPGLASISLLDGHRAVHVALSQGELEAAWQVAEELVALTRLGLVAAESDRVDRACFELSSALDDLGHVAMARRDFGQAVLAYKEGLGLARQLAGRSKASPAAVFDVTVSLENQARALAALGDPMAGLVLVRESIELSRGLAEGTDLFSNRQRDLARALGLAGELALQAGALIEATHCLDEAAAILRTLLKKWGPLPSMESELLSLLTGLAKLARVQRDWEAAQRFGRECLEIGRRLANRLPDSAQAAEDLAMALMVNLDLPDTPTDAYRDEALHVVADLRRRFPNSSRYAELETALLSGDNPS